MSPAKTGAILVSRERIEHVVMSRAVKDGVGKVAVLELFTQLFVEGGAAVAPNRSGGDRKGGYDTQIAMFRDTYKSRHPEVNGKSPVVILSLQSVAGLAFLRIETAYWTEEYKAKALRRGAL